MNILLLTSLILFTLITVYKTRLGLYLILILIPSFLIRAQIAGIPTTFLELAIYLLALIWFLKKVKDKKLHLTSYILHLTKPFLIPLILFTTAFIISTIISPDKRLSLGILKAWLFDPLLFTLIFVDQINPRIYLRAQKHITRVITSLGLMALWISAYGLYEYFASPQNLIEKSRLDSIFTSANYVTMLLVPITLLILGYLIKLIRENNETIISRPRGFIIPLLILITTISIATIYLTKSYSGYLGLVIGLLILIILYPTKKVNSRIYSGGIIIAFLAFSTLFLYTQKDNPKFRALADLKGRTAIHARLQIWQTSYNIIRDNPVLGIGLGNFPDAYTNYLLLSVQNPLEYNVLKPHNLYLNLWLETGVLGLLAFLWLVIIFFRQNFRDKKVGNWKLEIGNSAASAAAMAALLTQGLFDTPYFKNDLSLIFWLLIGLAVINKKSPEHIRRDARVAE